MTGKLLQIEYLLAQAAAGRDLGHDDQRREFLAKMLAVAAEVADGLLVMPFNTAAHFRSRTLPALAEGLAAVVSQMGPARVEQIGLRYYGGLADSPAASLLASTVAMTTPCTVGSTPIARAIPGVSGWTFRPSGAVVPCVVPSSDPSSSP